MSDPPSMMLGCGTVLALQGIAILIVGAIAGMNRLMVVLVALGGTFMVTGLIAVYLNRCSDLPRGKKSLR